jgi:hypothetical protein
MEPEAGLVRQLFGDAVKALMQRRPKPSPKRTRGGDDEKGRAGIRLLSRYAVLRRAAVTSKIARLPFKQGKSIIRQAPAMDPRGLVPEPLDSMNPYCEPDAHLAGLEIDEGCNPPHDYFRLQL